MVNPALYKLQFFYIIFAVLLLDSTVLLGKILRIPSGLSVNIAAHHNISVLILW